MLAKNLTGEDAPYGGCLGTGVVKLAEGLNAGRTVRIAYRRETTYYHADNINTTEMVSLGYGGDDIADYRKVNYVVADYGYAAANDDCKVASVTLADATAKLDLEGHTLTGTADIPVTHVIHKLL